MGGKKGVHRTRVRPITGTKKFPLPGGREKPSPKRGGTSEWKKTSPEGRKAGVAVGTKRTVVP